ncbi:peroxidase family protein [Ramlibacter sp. WS9]|uniref:peroxidase family protein n=1 Tax=Ramlibacter sp. WS9 TaxID=1882741 RepID=UPI0018EE9863|nr:peroxidase family protein [Ramlibacter sp. WS9]
MQSQTASPTGDALALDPAPSFDPAPTNAPVRHADRVNVVSQQFKDRLLNVICALVGAMMLYRSVSDSFYPGYIQRQLMAPIFLGGAFGIYLMYLRYRIGFWIFTALNFLVGYWFIFVLEDIWYHHVLPHVVFSALFLPFYTDMKSLGLLPRIKEWLGDVGMKLLEAAWLVRLLAEFPLLERWVNRQVIDGAVSRVRTRPHPWSNVYPYVSWRGLMDRTWSARHLPAWTPPPGYAPPEPAKVAELFVRPTGKQSLCKKSTCLFPAFAQYLTDGFIRTSSDQADPNRQRRNTSNHGIDLCQLYGLNDAQTRLLRVVPGAPETRGLLKSQVEGEEYAPYLYAGDVLDPQFIGLDMPIGLDDLNKQCEAPDSQTREDARARRAALFAFGGDRANSVPQTAMMNTLFLREHNRIARKLGELNAGWDDDRVFETTRMVVIVEFIKIVVEDYINHITPLAFKIRADPSIAWNAGWNKPNWITTEFGLLYRWHSLIPDHITWSGISHPVGRTFFDNRLLVRGGLRRAFEDMSGQPAGALGALNTADSLHRVEIASILQGRICELAPLADYQEYVRMKRPKTFEDISSSPDIVAVLKARYSSPELVEFFPGLFSEDRVKNSPLPQTILRMVAVDAFSQALTNPLLSEHVFNASTFSEYGLQQIEQTSTLSDLLRRVLAPREAQALGYVGMTRSDWRRE